MPDVFIVLRCRGWSSALWGRGWDPVACGAGLMIAVELYPDAGGARPICEKLLARGLLAKETHEHIIRIAPPLVLTQDQADWIARQFAVVLYEEMVPRDRVSNLSNFSRLVQGWTISGPVVFRCLFRR